MIKKTLNQNDINVQELIDTVEPNFIFDEKPINRFNIIRDNYEKKGTAKIDQLSILQKHINSIENCNLKKKLKKFGYG